MFTEGLALWPFRIEPVEDLIQPTLGDAGALIAYFKTGAAIIGKADGKIDAGARRRKGHCIAKQIIQYLHDPAILNHHRNLVVSGDKAQFVRFGCRLPGRDKALHQITQINAACRFCCHLIIKTAGTGNIADQTVEPDNITQNDRHQLLLLLRIGNTADGLGSTAQR